MIGHRAQDGGGRNASEWTDEGPVIVAGLPLPAAVTGAHPRRLVKEVLGPGKHRMISSCSNLRDVMRTSRGAGHNCVCRPIVRTTSDFNARRKSRFAAAITSFSGCRRAVRPLLLLSEPESRRPAHSRYPEHIRG